MTFKEACNYIEETPKFTRKHSLSHTEECLRRLGNPEKAFRVIHVAGTNGKGSTCAFLDSCLRQAGYRTGLFTSPHLTDIRERFMISGEMVSEETFLSAFERVRILSEEMEAEGEGHPAYFEMLFLMGMLIFKENGAEIVVLETGLGGRLDATTAVRNPAACVITSISRDHMQYLGDTVEEIAGEKAGIIAPGVPVIFDASDERAASVIRKRAEELHSPAYAVRPDEICISKKGLQGIAFLYGNDYDGHNSYNITSFAEYQVMNACLAIRTLRVLADLSGEIRVPYRQIWKGILETRWPGRMEMVFPGVIVDGAHNEDGVQKFLETAESFREENTTVGLLFSAVNDKDYKSMISRIAERLAPDWCVTTEVGGSRQVPAEELAALLASAGVKDAEAVRDPREAFRIAFSKKPAEGVLFCAGSLYLAGIIKDTVSDMEAGRGCEQLEKREGAEVLYDRL